MLKYALKFFGFGPKPQPSRPPSARRVAPTARPVVPSPTAAAEESNRRNAELRAKAAALTPDPNGRFAVDVATVVRTFDPHSTQPSAEQLHLALCRLGDVGAYVRAIYVGGGKIAVLSASHQGDRGRTKAYREYLESRARTDFEGWTQGLAALDRAVAGAKRTGDPEPAGIYVPQDVEDGIARLAAEKARKLTEAAARRKGGNGGSDGTGAGPQGGAAPAAPPALPLAPDSTKGTEEETPEGSEPPAGPRR